MAQAKPICINPSTLRVFDVRPELGSSALPPPRLAQQRPAFLQGVDRAFLLMMVGSSAAPRYRLLDAAPPIEIRLEDFLLDVDIRSVLVHGLHPSETVVRAVLERTSCWALRRRMAALSPQTSHQVKAALRHAD